MVGILLVTVCCAGSQASIPEGAVDKTNAPGICEADGSCMSEPLRDAEIVPRAPTRICSSPACDLVNPRTVIIDPAGLLEAAHFEGLTANLTADNSASPFQISFVLLPNLPSWEISPRELTKKVLREWYYTRSMGGNRAVVVVVIQALNKTEIATAPIRLCTDELCARRKLTGAEGRRIIRHLNQQMNTGATMVATVQLALKQVRKQLTKEERTVLGSLRRLMMPLAPLVIVIFTFLVFLFLVFMCFNAYEPARPPQPPSPRSKHPQEAAADGSRKWKGNGGRSQKGRR